MAKAQNTFIKSKMNKDLDDRLLSKGEYRDAENINVSKSEGADVGALENVLGNVKLSEITALPGSVIIGYYMDQTNNVIYIYVTNYTDSSSNNLNNPAPEGSYNAIWNFNVLSGNSKLLIEGEFLNFSTTNLINGINLIEDLLFWTDDRNQPRKINTTLANQSSTYYTTEDQISVAKYYPYKTPSLNSTFKISGGIASVNISGSKAQDNNGIKNTSKMTPSPGSFVVFTQLAVGQNVFYATPITSSPNVFPGMHISTTGATALSAKTSKVSLVQDSNSIYYNKLKITVKDKSNGTGTFNIGDVIDTYWDMRDSDSTLQPGMFIVVDDPVNLNFQKQNIKVLSTDTVNNGVSPGGYADNVIIESTADNLIWTNLSLEIYYPTSYTRAERFTSSSIIGQIVSGSDFFTPQNNNIRVTGAQLLNPGAQETGFTFYVFATQQPKKGMLVTCPMGGGNRIGTNSMTPIRENTVLTNDAEYQTTGDYPGSYKCNTNFRFNKNLLLTSNMVTFSPENPYYRNTWPGDPDFLTEKFVRFAYRFKFEDGEYSLISPFTQPAFVPKQDGYLTSNLKVKNISLKSNASDLITTYWQGNQEFSDTGFSELVSQEDNISESTIVSFFENRIDEVDINIPCDYVISRLNSDLKVEEVDILYKESDGLIIKVLDTIAYTDDNILNNFSNVLTYNYQSRKPFKNLAERDTVRVYDKIPVRAKTQSVTGNRLVYGNFLDKPTPPLTLDYSVGVTPKFRVDEEFSNKSAASSYITHSVKQNRNYQVGVVLQDKYGRSSDVVVSSLGQNAQVFPLGSTDPSSSFSGSTIFHDYRGRESNIYNWFGDSIKMLWNEPIPDNISYASGYPGLYRDNIVECIASTSGVAPTALLQVNSGWKSSIAVGSVVKFSNGTTNYIIGVNQFLEQITLSEELSSVFTAQKINVVGNGNPLGWYSYKIVVKQEAEDYYNAYLPNPLAGTTQYSIPLSHQQSILTLAGDNINKIPIDSPDPAPEQTQFGSSDTILYPRVAARNWNPLSEQFRPSEWSQSQFFTVASIGKVSDMGLNTNTYQFASRPNVIKASGIRNAKSDPTVATISTYQNKFGAWYNNCIFTNSALEEVLNNGDVDDGSVFIHKPAPKSGSLNPDMAITNSPVTIGRDAVENSPYSGSLFPNPDTTWANENEPGIINIGTSQLEEGSQGWGRWSHPMGNDTTSLMDGNGTGVVFDFTRGQVLLPSYVASGPNYNLPTVNLSSGEFRILGNTVDSAGLTVPLCNNYLPIRSGNLYVKAVDGFSPVFTKTLTQAPVGAPSGDCFVYTPADGNYTGTGLVIEISVIGNVTPSTLNGIDAQGNVSNGFETMLFNVQTSRYYLERVFDPSNISISPTSMRVVPTQSYNGYATQIKVIEGGTGYFAGDLISIIAGSATVRTPAIPVLGTNTWLYVNTSRNDTRINGTNNVPNNTDRINIVLRKKDFYTESGIAVQPGNGNTKGSGMRVRGMAIGPWTTSGTFTKKSDDITASPASMFWQVTALGSGYKPGDVIKVPPWGGGAFSYQGTFWNDNLKFTLEEEHFMPRNRYFPDPVGILEIKPKNSNLDIYWETSTSGLISELNDTINSAAAANTPYELVFDNPSGSKFSNLSYSEKDAPGTVLSNFTVKNINGSPLDGASFELIKVEDGANTTLQTGNGQIGTAFILNNVITSGAVSNTQIKNGVVRAYRNDPLLNNFTFYLKAEYISSGIGYYKDFIIQGTIGNAAPTIVGTDLNQRANIVVNNVSATTPTDVTLYAINGTHPGGVASTGTSERAIEIFWQKGQNIGGIPGGTGVVIGFQYFSFVNGINGTGPENDGTNSNLNKNILRFNPTQPPGASSGNGDTYSIPIDVVDASGSGLTSSPVTVTFNIPAETGVTD